MIINFWFSNPRNSSSIFLEQVGGNSNLNFLYMDNYAISQVNKLLAVDSLFSMYVSLTSSYSQ